LYLRIAPWHSKIGKKERIPEEKLYAYHGFVKMYDRSTSPTAKKTTDDSTSHKQEKRISILRVSVPRFLVRGNSLDWEHQCRYR